MSAPPKTSEGEDRRRGTRQQCVPGGRQGRVEFTGQPSISRPNEFHGEPGTTILRTAADDDRGNGRRDMR